MMVRFGQKGSRTRKENRLQQKIDWSDRWRNYINHIRFLIQAVFDILPNLAKSHLRQN